MNFDASKMGVPFLRAHRITILYPDNNQMPEAVVEQSLAVLLADGTVRKLEDVEAIIIPLDLAAHGNDPVPLIHPTTGAALGPSTTMNNVVLQIFSVIRKAQMQKYPADPVPPPVTPA